MKPFLLCIGLLGYLISSGQTKPQFFWSAYGEVYATYDFHQRRSNLVTPTLLYNYKRNNEVNVNLVLVRGIYQAEKVRAHVGVMAGNYVDYNLVNEPIGIRNIYECNGGIRLLRNEQLWFDAGIFESYLGFESPIGASSPTLTRSLFAENSPYYLSGARIHYVSHDSIWSAACYYLNGWQRTYRPAGLNRPSWGTHVGFAPRKNLKFSLGTFWGGDVSYGSGYTRYFVDAHVRWSPFRNMTCYGLVDYGFEEHPSGGTRSRPEWYSLNLILQYRLTESVRLAGRLERYSDPNYVIVDRNGAGPFETNAFSCNFDIQVTPQVLFRGEGRYFLGDRPLYRARSGWARDVTLLTGSLAFSF